MFERFSDRARRVIVLSQEEAKRLNHHSIGTEHILLGLIREGQDEDVAVQALELLGLDLAAVRHEVEEIIGHGEQAPAGHMPFTPRAKKVLELSLREALQLGDDHIGAEHILLGLLREGDGVAAQVLVRQGADLNRVRGQVIRQMTVPLGGGPVGGEAESRLTVVEQWVGIAPATADLDQQIMEVRNDRHAAIAAEDYDGAASLRDREKELRAVKLSRYRQWTAEHQDQPTLAEQVRQLSEEVEQLRGLLRRHGLEPDEGTA